MINKHLICQSESSDLTILVLQTRLVPRICICLHWFHYAGKILFKLLYPLIRFELSFYLTINWTLIFSFHLHVLNVNKNMTWAFFNRKKTVSPLSHLSFHSRHSRIGWLLGKPYWSIVNIKLDTKKLDQNLHHDPISLIFKL